MAGVVRSAGGGWALRAICALGAAAMAAAGVYLFDPSLIDLGLYVEPGKFALAGYALIYAALLVGFAAMVGAPRTGRPSVDFLLWLPVGPIALLGLGGIFGALSGEALLFRDPPVYWVGMLAIPAALCFAAAVLSDRAERRAEVAEAGVTRERTNDRATSWGLLGAVVWMSAYIASAVILLTVAAQTAYLLFYLLRANLLEGRDIEIARIGPAILNLLRDSVSERLLLALVMGGAIAVLILIIAAGGAWLSRSRPGRELSQEDLALVAQRAAEVRTYAEARGYSRYARRILWFVILPSLFAPMLLVLAAAFGAEKWYPWPYDPAALSSLGWHIYEHRMGPSAVVMLFAALFWGVLPNAVISRLSHAYSEIAGWSGFADGKRPVEEYVAQDFEPGKPFDPGSFLRRLNTSFEPYFLIPAVPLTLAAGILWHHDLSRYHLFTERYVEVMSYWSLEKHRYAYSDVQGVVLGCSYDRDGREEASYTVLLPDGFSAEPFRNGPETNVADLAKIDSKIGPAAPRTYAMRTPLFQAAAVDYDGFCVETLAAAMGEAEGVQFRDVMRVETWQRQRWRERIGVAK